MSRLTELTKCLLEVPLAEAPSISTLSQRANRRRIDRRRRGFIFGAIAVLGVAISGTTFELNKGLEFKCTIAKCPSDSLCQPWSTAPSEWRG